MKNVVKVKSIERIPEGVKHIATYASNWINTSENLIVIPNMFDIIIDDAILNVQNDDNRFTDHLLEWNEYYLTEFPFEDEDLKLIMSVNIGTLDPNLNKRCIWCKVYSNKEVTVKDVIFKYAFESSPDVRNIIALY